MNPTNERVGADLVGFSLAPALKCREACIEIKTNKTNGQARSLKNLFPLAFCWTFRAPRRLLLCHCASCASAGPSCSRTSATATSTSPCPAWRFAPSARSYGRALVTIWASGSSSWSRRTSWRVSLDRTCRSWLTKKYFFHALWIERFFYVIFHLSVVFNFQNQSN